MNERIELHVQTNYDYINKGSILSPKMLFSFIQKENIKTIGIVDFAVCGAIPELERWKEKLNLSDLKIIYGISLILKIKDDDVQSILLAKDREGINALYYFVSIMNERKAYFLLEEEFNLYKDHLIVGLCGYSSEKNYQKVISNYTYLEIYPTMSKEEVLNAIHFAKQNNLLVTASSCPSMIQKERNEAPFETWDLLGIGIYPRHYESKEELFHDFSYLNNKEEIILDNPEKIADQVKEYQFDFHTSHRIKTLDEEKFVHHLWERANFLYIEDIPKEVEKRLNKEIQLFKENDLIGTFELLEEISNCISSNQSVLSLSGDFSHCLISYLLGLTFLNPMDVEEENLSFMNKKALAIDLFFSGEYNGIIEEFIKKYLSVPYLYYVGNYVNNVHDEKNFEVKLKPYFTCDTYFLVPPEISIHQITPTNVIKTKYKDYRTLLFGRYLKSNFITLRFRPTYQIERLSKLMYKIDSFDKICAFDDQKVLNRSYQIKDSLNNDLQSIFKRRIELLKPQKIESIRELVEKNGDDNSYWLTNVTLSYIDTFYELYYPKEYYEIYLEQIVHHFRSLPFLTKSWVNQIKENCDEIYRFVLKEDNHLKLLLFQTIKRMMDLDLEESIYKFI